MRGLIDPCGVVYVIDGNGCVHIPRCEIDRLRGIIRVLGGNEMSEDAI